MEILGGWEPWVVQGELREQEPRFHCVARLPRGPMVAQPGLLCAGRALAPPSPVLGSPYPSSRKSGHFLCHVSPRWLQRTPKHPHICSHDHAHSLKAQSTPTDTLHPHSPLHTHWGAGASHEAQEPHTFFHHAPPHPLPPPEGYVGLGRVRGECRPHLWLLPSPHQGRDALDSGSLLLACQSFTPKPPSSHLRSGNRALLSHHHTQMEGCQRTQGSLVSIK